MVEVDQKWKPYVSQTLGERICEKAEFKLRPTWWKWTNDHNAAASVFLLSPNELFVIC